MMKVINILGGPGCGKSTIAAGILYYLKCLKFDVELVREYVKDAVYEKNESIFNDQIYIFGNQQRKQFILKNEVDIIVTDSPILLSAVYAPVNYFPSFETLCMEAFSSYDNINYFIQRSERIEYNPKNRIQTNRNEAIKIDDKLIHMMFKYGISYEIINQETAVKDIIQSLKTSHNLYSMRL